ncbi:unnamed protein product [Lampetra planeri]
MSKHLKKKNPPVPSSDDDDSPTPDLSTPGAVNPITATTAGGAIAPEENVGVAPSSSLRVGNYWQCIMERLNSLQTVLLQLVKLDASFVMTGRLQDESPDGDVQGSFRGTSEDPSMHSTAAIMAVEGPSAFAAGVDATWREAAILGAAVEARSEPTILLEPHGELPCGALPAGSSGVGRSHHLPHIKELVAAGGECFHMAVRVSISFSAVDGRGGFGCVTYPSRRCIAGSITLHSSGQKEDAEERVC